MPAFNSSRSKRVLSEIHADLVEVCQTGIKHVDFSLIDGSRTVKDQQMLYSQGKSKLDGIRLVSRHQVFPGRPKALAFDFIPYPLPDNNWDNRPLFTAYAHFLLGIGYAKGIELRWGGDWDRDFEWRDQTFHDFPHIELVNF